MQDDYDPLGEESTQAGGLGPDKRPKGPRVLHQFTGSPPSPMDFSREKWATEGLMTGAKEARSAQITHLQLSNPMGGGCRTKKIVQGLASPWWTLSSAHTAPAGRHAPCSAQHVLHLQKGVGSPAFLEAAQREDGSCLDLYPTPWAFLPREGLRLQLISFSRWLCRLHFTDVETKPGEVQELARGCGVGK